MSTTKRYRIVCLTINTFLSLIKYDILLCLCYEPQIYIYKRLYYLKQHIHKLKASYVQCQYLLSSVTLLLQFTESILIFMETIKCPKVQCN